MSVTVRFEGGPVDGQERRIQWGPTVWKVDGTVRGVKVQHNYRLRRWERGEVGRVYVYESTTVEEAELQKARNED